MQYEKPDIEIILCDETAIFTVHDSNGDGTVGDGSDIFG